jgi:hypothetical protein
MEELGMKKNTVLKVVSTLALLGMTVGCATTREAAWQDKAAGAEKVEESTAADALAALTGEADAAWALRSDPKQAQTAIAKWTELSAQQPTAETYVKIAYAHYFLGNGHFTLTGDAAGADQSFTDGLTAAEKGLAISAPEMIEALNNGVKHTEALQKATKEAVPSLYWHATNLSKWAASKGFATKLRYKDDVKATQLHVKGLDETFFYYAPYRYFGAFEAATAGLLGGDLNKSTENFKQAAEMAPHYLDTKVMWADYQCKKAVDKETYVKLLNEVLAADPTIVPELEPENRIAQTKAKTMLDNVDEYF